jgi:hypothetical protein
VETASKNLILKGEHFYSPSAKSKCQPKLVQLRIREMCNERERKRKDRLVG